jgi:threonine dehydrogenase-like Zn-dependent dehydrogenase
MIYSGICGGDPGIFASNLYGGTPEYPRVLGHEFYGEIVEVYNPEDRPSRVKKGDFVVGAQNKPCGVCDQCLEGRFSVCSGMYGAFSRPTGCFAEYFERDLDKLFPIASGVDPLVAALAEPLAVGVFDIRNSRLGVGDDVLVIGAGAIGILIGLLARLNGAALVCFSEVSESRITFMRAMGFEAYNAKDDVVRIMREKTGGKGPDYVFEVSGSQPGWDLALEAVRQGGMVLPIGSPFGLGPPVTRAVDYGKIYQKEIDLNPVNMHHLGDFAEAAHLINRGDLNQDLRRLVTSIWPLDRTAEAIEASRDKTGNNIKILIRPGPEEIESTLKS